ncbi:hypothetical protein K439DRAFT_1617875 [Ramaria rubella]|nr:hypothetical protein K439DRAFT_1617875 [Ramaria rubella]
MPQHKSLSPSGRQYWCKFCENYINIRGFTPHAGACEKRQQSEKAAVIWLMQRREDKSNAPSEILSNQNLIEGDHGLDMQHLNIAEQDSISVESEDSISQADSDNLSDSAMCSKVTANFLQAITHDWTDPGHSQLTFSGLADYRQSLAAAWTFNVQFQSGTVMATFNGEEHTFEFQFRDPWKWILNLTTDPSLASSILWYPVEKTLHENGTQTRLYDEINSGNTWWEIQDQLPVVPDLPHCFLPLHLWMDKGKVSTTVTMHPILLRPGFLPGPIRNGSRNGGAVLLGYMPKVVVPDVKKSQQIPFALFKREVYHKILRKIFSSLIDPSKYGQAVKCGDSIHHVLFPGFYILSLDGEEAACACATRGSKANHPCPCCLVHTDQLHNLTTPNFVARTSANMWAIWQEAQSARTKTAVEEILKNNGLHNIRICSKNVFWALGNYDPYAACAYDTMHAVELGV